MRLVAVLLGLTALGAGSSPRCGTAQTPLRPPAYDRWQAPSQPPRVGPAWDAAPVGRPSVRNAVIGGMVGAAVGLVACNLLAMALIDSSGCTTEGNTTFALGGAALGGAIGLLWGTAPRPP